MILDVISGFFLGMGEAGILLLLIVFLVVVLSLNKIFCTAKGIVPAAMHFLRMLLAVSVASALFPVFAGRLLGLPVAVSTESIIFFVTMGITLYFFYLFATGVYRFLGALEKYMPSFHRKKFHNEKWKTGAKTPGRSAIAGDGDTSRFVKKKAITPVREILFDEKDD